MFINWNVTTRFDPNSLQPSTHGIPVPSYGNYGGPNYSAGVEGGTTPETPTNPAPVDALDFLFWQHDLVYQHVQNGAAPPTAIAPADVLLVEGMYGLTQTDFFNNNPEALLYDALGTLTIVGKILTTPEEFAYFQTLSPPEQYLVGVLAPQEAVQNFEIGLAETPGNEARSLHGAFQVFEAHFAENIAVAGAFGTLNDAGQITGTHFHASAENSFLADPNPTATQDRANLIFSRRFLSMRRMACLRMTSILSPIPPSTVNQQMLVIRSRALLLVTPQTRSFLHRTLGRARQVMCLRMTPARCPSPPSTVNQQMLVIRSRALLLVTPQTRSFLHRTLGRIRSLTSMCTTIHLSFRSPNLPILPQC
jgi:hypothetical protein